MKHDIDWVLNYFIEFTQSVHSCCIPLGWFLAIQLRQSQWRVSDRVPRVRSVTLKVWCSEWTNGIFQQLPNLQTGTFLLSGTKSDYLQTQPTSSCISAGKCIFNNKKPSARNRKIYVKQSNMSTRGILRNAPTIAVFKSKLKNLIVLEHF